MKTNGRIIILVASILLILAACSYLLIIVTTTKTYDWMEFTIGRSDKGYMLTPEALLDSDIPIPEIRKLSGKGKFIKALQASSDDVVLGYVISVDIDKLDLEKLPQKYKVEKKEQYKAGEITVLPIEDAVYAISFEFSLNDKDGFELMKLESPSHWLYTGKVNDFQNTVKQAVAAPTAVRVASIGLYMTIEKCVTCRSH